MDLLSWLDRFGGVLLAVIFFLIVGYVFYWIVVILPRRIRAVFAGLTARGFHPCAPGDPMLAGILAKGAPVFPIDPLPEKPLSAWTVQHAAVRTDRILINAYRDQVDRLPHKPARRSTTLLIDTLPTSLRAEFHLVPVQRVFGIQWKERHGLQPVSSGLDPDLAAHYEVLARPEVSIDVPPALVRVLIQVHPVLADRSAFCFQRGAALRFQAACWGICTSHAIYREADMTRFLDLADTLTQAFRSVT